uniref:Discs, large (Drosophila) homolog-associated protein 5 n=1 Tax=Amphilophus citrinellus TaxID=61819 RepID=A0A3Q0R278_AMPCI
MQSTVPLIHCVPLLIKSRYLIMESRFAHLRERDTSVSMLRVKMSRRRSQSQKENRERTVNTRRQLDKLPELEMSSLDASMAMANISTIQDKTQNNLICALTHAFSSTAKAVEERIKQLERWKERKALEKEKEKRERDRKGVFKIGLYHPQNMIASLPAVPDASTRVKEVRRDLSKEHFTLFIVKHVCESHRFQPFFFFFFFFFFLKENSKCVCLFPPSDIRTTRSRANLNPVKPELTEPEMQEVEKKPSSPSPTRCSQEEEMVVDHAPAQSVPAEPASSSFSFAPEGFVFQAPNGLSSFKFEPLTPRSADAFLTPRSSFFFFSPLICSFFFFFLIKYVGFKISVDLNVLLLFPSSSSFNLPPAPVFGDEQSESSPPKSPLRTSPTIVPPTPGEAVETKHDVPYFRFIFLTHCNLVLFFVCSVRDRMRTAVGQARLLMKERFNQFSGLVDDCELGRGDKITTCTDLQGFWDMVYYQVMPQKTLKVKSLKLSFGLIILHCIAVICKHTVVLHVPISILNILKLTVLTHNPTARFYFHFYGCCCFSRQHLQQLSCVI